MHVRVPLVVLSVQELIGTSQKSPGRCRDEPPLVNLLVPLPWCPWTARGNVVLSGFFEQMGRGGERRRNGGWPQWGWGRNALFGAGLPSVILPHPRNQGWRCCRWPALPPRAEASACTSRRGGSAGCRRLSAAFSLPAAVRFHQPLTCDFIFSSAPRLIVCSSYFFLQFTFLPFSFLFFYLHLVTLFLALLFPLLLPLPGESHLLWQVCWKWPNLPALVCGFRRTGSNRNGWENRIPRWIPLVSKTVLWARVPAGFVLPPAAPGTLPLSWQRPRPVLWLPCSSKLTWFSEVQAGQGWILRVQVPSYLRRRAFITSLLGVSLFPGLCLQLHLLKHTLISTKMLKYLIPYFLSEL